MIIGIVDDNETDLKRYAGILKNNVNKKHQVLCFNHPEEVKAQLDELDIVFLDVQMPEQDGISLAQELLEEKPRLIVIFLSDYDSYVWNGFFVDAIYYIRKRYFEKELPNVMEKIKRRLEQSGKTYISLKGKRQIHQLNIRDILYIEAQGKFVKIVMKDDALSIRCSISAMETKLAEYYFIKVHRCYLVNAIHIEKMKDRSVNMNNGVQIPISKYRSEEVHQEYLSYLATLI